MLIVLDKFDGHSILVAKAIIISVISIWLAILILGFVTKDLNRKAQGLEEK